jgi:NADPH:quinone reductase-like Zn-dependent oxidoreductase
MMRAIVSERYGGPEVMELRDIPQPTPKEGEVLVKVRAAALNAADWHMLRADPWLVRLGGGLTKPKNKILGGDVAGVVEAVGRGVTQFKVGDAVFGEIAACGFGGLAEYVCVPEKYLALKSSSLSFEQAAAVPMAGLTAVQALRDKGQVRAGQQVMIHGAGGGVGLFAVQIAKALGAEVTAVCGPRNVQRVKALGADHVIDYTKEDFVKRPERYDLIVATNGDRTLGEYRQVLKPGGQYVMVGGSTRQLFQGVALGPLYSLGSGKKLGNMMAHASRKDLLYLQELIEAGKITPVIDRCYPLEKTPEAMRYLEEGHAQGKIVITVAGDGTR